MQILISVPSKHCCEYRYEYKRIFCISAIPWSYRTNGRRFFYSLEEECKWHAITKTPLSLSPGWRQAREQHYGETFDQVVSAAQESGQAPVMDSKKIEQIFAGLNYHAEEGYAGTVLSPFSLKRPSYHSRQVNGQFQINGIHITLDKFCQWEQVACPDLNGVIQEQSAPKEGLELGMSL